ncbi:MAG: L-histidine N(alpha)-methyltransferase [Planctomycetales bacterium]
MSRLDLQDHAPSRTRFLEDVLAGLRARPKTLPCKYLYDERGSRLFDRICGLPEYYPTRTELAIMRRRAAEMARRIGPRAALVEYGSGSCLKTHLLLAHLERPAAYVPVDISREHLRKTAEQLDARYECLPILPVCADFTQPFQLPAVDGPSRRTIVYFPGSTIGNFVPEEAVALLAGVARLVGPSGGLLIGADLLKPRAILEAAYDDSRGVTAEFNLNLLARIDRELDGEFDPHTFEHRAVFDEERGRVEMQLVSRIEQSVRVGDEEFDFSRGETIHTENSHKYTLESFAMLAARAGFAVERAWTDPQRLFSVQYLTVDSGRRSEMAGRGGP